MIQKTPRIIIASFLTKTIVKVREIQDQILQKIILANQKLFRITLIEIFHYSFQTLIVLTRAWTTQIEVVKKCLKV
jgi:hypothetical protein